MAFEYVNRRDERYYLLQGKTKTGKPTYYASRKARGVPCDQLPEGYEIYEHPEQGIVSVRKVRHSRVLPGERDILADLTRELAGIEHFCVDIQDDSLVIYTPSIDPASSVNALSRLFGPFAGGAASEREWIGKHQTYLPMMRFTLVDEESRLYYLERWCFRGSIDDWFLLTGGHSLERLARKYLPHLGQESFYELM